mmetsp:Transcript_23476/g.65974  ORF Transcript_23476/g.65974 Transcript_23476/m.65974 type:complete len:251 (+) Transcript_23476:305-1057(+)
MRIRSTQLMTPRVSQSCPSCALIARAIRCPTDMPAGMRNALHAISGVLCRPQSGFHVLDLNIPRGTQRAFTFSGPRGSGAVRRCESVYLIGVTPCLSSVHPRRRTLSFQPCTPPGVAPPPEESNPCCAHPAYRVALRRLVPQITSLDGERLALVDASGGGSSDGSILGDLNVGGTNGDQSWFTTEDLAVGGSSMTAGAGRAGMVAGQPLAGLAELEAALADAKRLGARAKAMVDDAQPGVQGGASRVRAR